MMKVSSKEEIIQMLRDHLPHLYEKYGVERIALYGSFAKEAQHPDSDVDLIVELSEPLGFAFVSLADEMEDILGRPVHLSTFDMLERTKHHESNPYRRRLAKEVEASLIYI